MQHLKDKQNVYAREDVLRPPFIKVMEKLSYEIVKLIVLLGGWCACAKDIKATLDGSKPFTG